MAIVEEWQKILWNDWLRPECTRTRHLQESASAIERHNAIMSGRTVNMSHDNTAVSTPPSPLAVDTRECRRARTRVLVDVIGESGIEDFIVALQRRLDQGWSLVSYTCTEVGSPPCWYTALLTRRVP